MTTNDTGFGRLSKRNTHPRHSAVVTGVGDLNEVTEAGDAAKSASNVAATADVMILSTSHGSLPRKAAEASGK